MGHMSLWYAICPSPWWSLTTQRSAFAFLLLPYTVICYLLKADKQTRRQMQRRKKNGAIKSVPPYSVCCKMHTVFIFCFLFFYHKKCNLKAIRRCLWCGTGTNTRLKYRYSIKSRSLSGDERQGELSDASKSVFGAKLTCHHRGDWGAEIRLTFPSVQPSHFLYLSPSSLSSSVPSSLCQSRYSKKNKTAYHDDKGDRSYKAPYEMIVHT